MDRRSTNDIGYVHYQGDIVSNVGSSHGVRLGGGSTGAVIEPLADDTSARLTIRGKGAGALALGESSATIIVGAGSTGSTTGLSWIQRYLVQWTVPALGTGSTGDQTTVTVAGLTTNSILAYSPRARLNSTIFTMYMHARCSTVNELVILSAKTGEDSVSGSTQSAYLLQFRF